MRVVVTKEKSREEGLLELFLEFQKIDERLNTIRKMLKSVDYQVEMLPVVLKKNIDKDCDFILDRLAEIKIQLLRIN